MRSIHRSLPGVCGNRSRLLAQSTRSSTRRELSTDLRIQHPQVNVTALAALIIALTACASAQVRAQVLMQEPANHSAASPDATLSAYLQGNWAEHNTHAATLGVTVPWKHWRTERWGSEIRGHWDLYASRWTYDGAGDHRSSWLLGVVPSLRLRPDHGQSRWFAEVGVGVVYMTNRYHTVHKEFSTSFNFASHIGLGYNFGNQRRHELQVRIEHISNAALKQPNPGENFIQLRYGFHF